MQIIIFIGIIILCVVYVLALCSSLNGASNKTKVIAVIISSIFMYVITQVIYNRSQIGITYNIEEVQTLLSNLMIFTFLPANGLILLPYLFITIQRYRENIIDSNKLILRIAILVVIVVLFFIFEYNCMRSTGEYVLNFIKK